MYRWFFWPFSVSSCTERINNIQLDNTFKHLVVYGEITSETGIHWVRLSSTENYFYNKPSPPVTGAAVFISDGTDTTMLSENQEDKGLYQTYDGYRGIAGKTYTLYIDKVDINGDGKTEGYQASSFLPPVNPVDSITLTYTKNTFSSGWEIHVWAQDPGDQKNFYAFKAWKNGVLLTDTLTEYFVQNDELFNGNYTYGIEAQYLSDRNGTEKAVPGDTVTFELDGITEDYYNFIQDAKAESFGSNPLFSGPPANITGNISNNALGFFTAYSVAKASRIVPPYSSAN